MFVLSGMLNTVDEEAPAAGSDDHAQLEFLLSAMWQRVSRIPETRDFGQLFTAEAVNQAGLLAEAAVLSADETGVRVNMTV